MIREKRFLKFFLPLLLIACVTLRGVKPPEAGQLEVGKTYHGFKLVRQEKVKEVDAVGLLFEHTKSGARLLKLKADDDNNTFCISFKTTPKTDSGTPHIMEHSVLNGSRKFPVKSPFDVLKKGSLHTFLNALTGNDVTLYPAASRNDKDFFNLVDVYLDAVLFPRIYDEPRILQREGWHYELESKDSELKINGIVYNEMQGSYSRDTAHLIYHLQKNLFPDNCYGSDSGGHPDHIPELTYRQFLDFHKKYYHPSNSYITLHGDGNVLEELKFIDENYLSKFNRSTDLPQIPLQEPFTEMKEMNCEYPISIDGSEKDNTWLSLAFVTGQSRQRDITMGLEILKDVLVNQPAAPVRRALMDAGIGKEVIGFFSKNKQNFFAIAVKNANDTDKEKFNKIVFDTLQKVVKKGLDKRVLEGALNRLEFQLREGRRFPGLSHTFNALPGWMFANDPFLSLEYEKPLNTLKKGLKTNYFETLIETYLLKNNHSLMLVMTPKKGMVEQGRKKLKEKLAKYKASLSDKELEKLVQQTGELKEYKETPDSPEALNTIPLLSLKDVEPKAEKLEADVGEIAEAPGVKVLVYPAFTNNIIYTRLLFDASVVPQELLPYANLLAQVLGELSTKKYSYGDLDTELNLHTGGVDFRIGTYLENYNHREIIPKFEVTGKVLRDKLDKLVVLEGEIIKNTIFNDTKRLKEVITRLNARHQMSIQGLGLRLATTRLVSYFSPYGKYLDLTRGLSYIHFVMEIGENFDKKAEEVISRLQKTAALIFNKNNLIVTVTCPDRDYKLFKEKLPELLAYVGDKTPKPVKYTFEYKEKNEGLQSASMVQYVTQGYDYKSLGYTYSGKFEVLAHILKRDYLQRKIRILGGAYGREAAFSREGFAVFGSYRDPQLTKTLEAYDQAADYLKNLKLDDREMTRLILGTIAGKDRPLRPHQKGRRAVSNYIQHLTYDEIQRERDEILSTTPGDIRKMAKMVADIMSKKTICVFGNEKKLEENKELFDKLVKVKQ